MPTNDPSDLDEIVSAVSSSKKYRTVCEDTIRNIAEHESARHDGLKAATKATKRRLHQVYGAFEQSFEYEHVLQLLQVAYASGSEERIKAACRRVLSSHSSTRERLETLDSFYSSVFEITGTPNAVLDLGCGLNPLALPWMDLPADARYIALDIDEDRVDFLNRYLTLAGLEPLARCQDVLVRPPDDDVDLALLLKMSPSLERQVQGATLNLLERLNAPFVVVSYAIKSLGGREKGMVAHYQQQFADMIQDRQWFVERLVFGTELVFIVEKTQKTHK